MEKKEVAIKIGGEAGFGIKVSGLILAKALMRAGFGVFGYGEYPSLIRGGHNTYQVNYSFKRINSVTKKIDILVALNLETVERHKNELNHGGVIIYDGLKLKSEDYPEINLVEMPLSALAEKAGGELTRNIVAIGAVAGLLNLDVDFFESQIENEFGLKGKEVVGVNKKALAFGHEEIKKHSKIEIKGIGKAAGVDGKQDNLLLTGNEAMARGLTQGGCKFFSAYPMTPATAIMHYFEEKQKDFNLAVHQAEDEIAAIGAAIGAGAVGVRAATATSGGGFALMVEHVGLAAITETPLVIVESQRPAPATGMPTWTEQGDLKFVLAAGHGDMPRIVMAPGSAEEAFTAGQQALGLAEKFQLPVIILLDKLISESDYLAQDLPAKVMAIKREGFISDDELGRMTNYKRYELAESGISKRALPGQKGGVQVSNSDEHDEAGFSTEESETRIKMMDKRIKKMKLIEAELPEPTIYGPAQADLTIVGWGSTKGVILDAMQEIENQKSEIRNQNINFLQIYYLWPFPVRRVKAILENAKNILLIENNQSGQLAKLIRQETGVEIKNKFLKYDGRPFFREEIIREIKKLRN